MKALFELVQRWEAANEALHKRIASERKPTDRARMSAVTHATVSHITDLKNAIILAGALPVVDNMTPEFAARLKHNAEGSGQTAAESMRASCNHFVHTIADLERREFGGVFLSRIVSEYLQSIDWAFVGEKIEQMADGTEPPQAIKCERADCAPSVECRSDGFQVVCHCGLSGPTQATDPQAIHAWNELFSRPPECGRS